MGKQEVLSGAITTIQECLRYSCCLNTVKSFCSDARFNAIHSTVRTVPLIFSTYKNNILEVEVITHSL